MIGKLINIEWNKLWPNRTFKVLFGIYAGVFLIFLLAMIKADNLRAVNDMAANFYNPLQFPDVFILVSIFAQVLTLLPCIIVIVLVTNEFQYKTARQHVIDGLTRFEFILCKFIDVKLMALLSTALVIIFGIIVGATSEQSGTGATFMQSFAFVIAFFFKTLGFLTFAMFLALWIKRTGLTILLFTVIHTGLFVLLIRNWLDKEIAQFLPISVFNRVISLNDSVIGTVQDLFQGKGDVNGAIDIVSVAPIGHFLLIAVYIAGFIGASYFILSRRDLKA